MQKVILRNAIKCNLCGTQIESRAIHDLQRCSCGQVAVDGGKDYLKRVGDREKWTEKAVVLSLPAGDGEDY